MLFLQLKSRSVKVGKTKLSKQDRLRIRKLRDEGANYSTLAEQYAVSITTIRRVCDPELYAKTLEASATYNTLNSKKIYEQQKANSKRYVLTLNVKKDSEIIDHLNEQKNIQAYLKSVVEKDINSKQGENNNGKIQLEE